MGCVAVAIPAVTTACVKYISGNELEDGQVMPGHLLKLFYEDSRKNDDFAGFARVGVGAAHWIGGLRVSIRTNQSSTAANGKTGCS